MNLDQTKGSGLHHFFGAIPGGLWAGLLVGLAEAIVVINGLSVGQEAQVLWYSPAIYGLAGLAIAVGISIAAYVFYALIGKKPSLAGAFAFSFSCVAVLLSLPIARFRIRRDILLEQPLSMLQNLALVAGAALLFLVLYFLLSRLFRLKFLEKLLCPLHSVIVFGAMVCVCLAVSFTLQGDVPKTTSTEGVADQLSERPNIILVIVDTLRADYVSAYGHLEKFTPALDSLATGGTLYWNNIAQASWTKPSIASILTGLYPSTHSATGKPHVLPSEVTTVAESLKDAGYSTGGIVTNINLSPLFGFDQGFDEFQYLAPDHYFGAKESSSRLILYSILRLVRERFLTQKKYFNHYYQDAEVVGLEVEKWLNKNEDERFFLLLHYMDPHDPFFEHPYNGTGIARVHTPNPDPSMAEKMRTYYKQEIRYWDENFGKFLDSLKTRGLFDDTMIVVTADHGEEFYEHKGWWHGTTLFDEQIRVPLVVKWPSGFQAPGAGAGKVEAAPISNPQNPTGQVVEEQSAPMPKVVTSQVRSIDIVPTILQMAGLGLHDSLQGLSLLVDPDKRQGHQAHAYSEEDFEGNILHSMRSNTWKWLTANPGNPRGLPEAELYDLSKDSAEMNNLAGEESLESTRTSLDGLLEDTKAFAESSAVKSATTDISDEDRERLKALGYIQD